MIAEKQIYDDIILEIKNQNPIPVLYTNMYISCIVAIMILSYFSSVLFTVWLAYEVFEKTRVCKFESCSIDSYIFGPTYEYGALAIMLGTLVYFLYRSTDWPYVKDRVFIVLTLILVGTALSGSTVNWLKSAHDPLAETIYDIKDSIKLALPWRNNLANVSAYNHKLKPLVGVVENSTVNNLILDMPLKQKINLFYEDNYPENQKPRVGTRAVVQIKLINNALYVESAEEL